MMAHQELVVSWLNDAYAMEQSIARVLTNHTKDAKEYAEVQERLQAHLGQTRRHAELIKGCLERLGKQPSTVKSGLANVMGTVQGLTTALAKDEVIKNALHDYATEHFEIAAYQSLSAAAAEIGDAETARVCQEILGDEQAMATWFAEQIPPLTRAILAQQAKEHTD